MKIVEFSIKRPVTITMLMTSLMIFGWLSFNRLPINLFPNISYPTVTIRTIYPDSTPLEIEALISRPIEEVVGSIPDVTRVSSISGQEISDVIVEFAWKTDMDFASLDIREKLDLVDLPVDAERPLLLRFNPASDPILRIGLYGDEDPVKLRLIAEDEIKPLLEGLSSDSPTGLRKSSNAGIAAVNISGGLEEEIQVEISNARLASIGISISQVIERLVEENVNLTGGKIIEGEEEHIVRTLSEFRHVDEIKDIVLTSNKNQIVRLGDVAAIKKGHKERSIITRINGKESIEIAIFKEADANTVSVARLVKTKLKELEEEFIRLGSKVRIEVVYDQSLFIEESIKNVFYTALWGGLLAVFVLYLFLQELKSTMIISMAIPLSVMASFFFMYISDITLNIMSLGGLAIGIGMMVDNSIVVLESAERYRRNGYSLTESAQLGTSEVGRAVTASTLTTICVFAPIIFVKGIAGQLFTDQALTVTYSLLTSLVVAITLIPMLSALRIGRAGASPLRASENRDSNHFYQVNLPPPVRKENLGSSRGAGGRAFSWDKMVTAPISIRPLIHLLSSFERIFSAIIKKYLKVMEFALNRKLLVIIIMAICFACAWRLFFMIGREFMPELSQGEFYISLKKPVGAPLKETLNTVRAMEYIILDLPEVKRVYDTIGSAVQTGGSPVEERKNIAELNILLQQGVGRDIEEGVMNRLRERFQSIPAVEYKFYRPAFFDFTTPIEVEIRGYNLKNLEMISSAVAKRLKDIHGLSDVKSSIEWGNPEIQITFDRKKIAQIGLDINSIASSIRSLVSGTVETEFRQQDRKIDIRVMAHKKDVKGINEVRNLIINPQDEIPVLLSSVASIEEKTGPSEIRRINHERAAIVSANLTGIDLRTAVSKIEGALREIRLPEDFEVDVSGQSREMSLAFSNMKFAILLAIFLVYIVMASQFESLLHPLIIMFTIPFALVGSVIALYITGKVISVVALIGVVMLAGIAVNNAIVLVDYIHQRRKDGMGIRDAIIEAGRRRLRPILMTTITTILGLLPFSLGLGKGGEMRASMGITVIGGLITSTVLTLIIIPVIYEAVEDIKARLAARWL